MGNVSFDNEISYFS